MHQHELADRAGMSVRAVRDLENGRVRAPRAVTLRRLADALGLPELLWSPEVPDAVAGTADGAGDTGPGRSARPRIDALGPLAVSVAGRQVPIESRMQRIVLGVLAVQPGTPVTRQALVDLLWGEAPPATATNLLHTYIARLRRRIPGLPIEREPGGYRLNLGPAELDVARFAELVADAGRATDGGSPPDAARHYLAALGLWRDAVLADLGERMSEQPAVAALRRQRVHAALRCAQVVHTAADRSAAVAELHRLADAEPWHERLHAALMSLLAASGQQADALAVYDAVRTRLDRDLGLDPGPELRAAHAQVLRSAPAPSQRAAAAAPLPPAPPRQLPAWPTRFIGRERELAELDGLAGPAGAGEPAVIAVCGIGGIGKTALVLRWAQRNLERFPDGQLWMDLRGYGPARPLAPGEVIEQLLRVLGVGTAQLPADLNARSALLRSAVAGRRMLLVLDNARDSAQVRPLLPGGSTLVTVVTSRDELRSLTAMDGAVRLHVPPLGASEGRDLLSVGVPGAVAAAVDATRIVEHCDGLPLALRIVRERLSTATESEVRRFAEELGGDERLNALDLNEATAELSVRGALSWSYRTLPEPAALLLRRLPLGRTSTVDVRIAAALTGLGERDTGQALDVLVAAHLVERAGAGRYHLHDLVTTFAAERLADEEPPARIVASRNRLCHLLARLATAALVRMRCRTRIVCALPGGGEEPAEPDAGESGPPEQFAEFDEFVAPAAELAHDLLADGAHQLCCALLERCWHVTYAMADTTRFESALTAAFDAAVAQAEPDLAIQMNRLLAVTYASNSSLERAESTLQRGIELATASGRPASAVQDTGNLARVWLMRGELGSARAAMHRVAEASESATMPRRPLLSNLIELECQCGDLVAAETLAVETRRYVAATDDWEAVRELVVGLSRVDLLAGRWQAARDRLESVGGSADDGVRNTELLVRMQVLLARACGHADDLPAAEAAAQEALRLTGELGWPSHAADALGELARLRIARGAAEQAIPLLRRALAHSRDCRQPYPECGIQLLLAQAWRELGDSARAVDAARQAALLGGRHGYRILAEQAGAIVAAGDGEPAG